MAICDSPNMPIITGYYPWYTVWTVFVQVSHSLHYLLFLLKLKICFWIPTWHWCTSTSKKVAWGYLLLRALKAGAIL